MKEDSEARRERLLKEALALPAVPGVYIMHDASDKIIYVGKSRKLRDRVSQYFRNTEKNLKTQRMADSVNRFECIFCDTEIEALTLENTFIKKYTPHYNIRLKDAKSYPYIKMTPGPWPVLTMSRKRLDDGGMYFGPYSGTSTVFSVISTVNRIFRLPSCRRKFPSDIGRDRPCLYYQMGRCVGVCTGKVSEEEYAQAISGAAELLRGKSAAVRRSLEERMLDFAEKEQYEAAAGCRDSIAALEKLSQHQKAVASPDTDQDVIGAWSDGSCAALSLLCIREGAIRDKLDFGVEPSVIDSEAAYMSILCEYYAGVSTLPGRVLLSGAFDSSDAECLAEYLHSLGGKKLPVTLPERGDNRGLCEMANGNAEQAVLKFRRDSEKSTETVAKLASILSLEVVPERMEAYDISNIGSEHITAGMIVFDNGSFAKKDYRSFTIKTTEGTDDYGAMREALTRRLTRLKNHLETGADEGSFGIRPDLILIDGGAAHLAVALSVMDELGIYIPCVGMVKDDGHRTRALVTPDGEADIAREQDVFVLIYRLQEEVHRFTVSRMTNAKRRTVKHSSLEKIPGIGPEKAKKLLKEFGGMAAVSNATAEQLAGVKGITSTDAVAIEAYFREKRGNKD